MGWRSFQRDVQPVQHRELAISVRVDDTSETIKLQILVTDAGLCEHFGGPDDVGALTIDDGIGNLNGVGREAMVHDRRPKSRIPGEGMEQAVST